MKQNKVPKNEYIRVPSGKTNPYKDDVIYDPRGQWAFPGQVTRIPGGDITMSGVPYPVYGVDDLGNSQMMYPGMDYTFPGQYVTEYPMAAYGGDPSLPNITGHYPFGGIHTKTHTHMKEGGWLDELDEEYRRGGQGPYTPYKLRKKSKEYGTSKNIQSSINRIFARNHDLFGSSGRNFYNPNSKYETGGGLDEYQNAGSTGVYQRPVAPLHDYTIVNGKPKIKYSAKEAEELNRQAEKQSREQARKEHVNEYIKESHKEAMLNSPFNIIASFTPAGAPIFAAQSAASALQNLEKGDYKAAGINAALTLPFVRLTKKFMKGLPKGANNLSSNIKDRVINASKTSSELAPELEPYISKKVPYLKDVFEEGLSAKELQKKYADNIKHFDRQGNVIPAPQQKGLNPGIADVLWDGLLPKTPFNEVPIGNQYYYRKIGNKAGLQDLIESGTTRQPGNKWEGAFYGWRKPIEDYEGRYAVGYNTKAGTIGMDFCKPGRAGCVGYLPTKKIDINDPALDVYKRRFMSTGYKRLDKAKLSDELAKDYALQEKAENILRPTLAWGSRYGVGHDLYYTDWDEVIGHKGKHSDEWNRENGPENRYINRIANALYNKQDGGGWLDNLD